MRDWRKFTVAHLSSYYNINVHEEQVCYLIAARRVRIAHKLLLFITVNLVTYSGNHDHSEGEHDHNPSEIY